MSRKPKTNYNQLSLPFDQIRKGAISYEDRQRFFRLFVSISLLSLAFYVYAVNATAHNIAVRQHLERKAAELASRIGSLEFAFIELKNSITMEKAAELGFREVKRPLYISRNPSVSLTLNTE